MDYADFGAQLTPYALTMSDNVAQLNLDVSVDDDIDIVRLGDQKNADFCDMLHRGARAVLGGASTAGSPTGALLDCAVIPAVMTGFKLPVDYVPAEIADRLEVPDHYDGAVPVSAYGACPTVNPQTVFDCSLHSHIPGHGVATRTKALGLAVLDARRQAGVTRFDDPSMRVHVRFGPLEVGIHRPPMHPNADDTIVYSLDLPDRDILLDIARGESEFGTGQRPAGQRWTFIHDDELAHGRLREHLDEGGRAWVIPPGWRAAQNGYQITMVLGDALSNNEP